MIALEVPSVEAIQNTEEVRLSRLSGSSDRAEVR